MSAKLAIREVAGAQQVADLSVTTRSHRAPLERRDRWVARVLVRKCVLAPSRRIWERAAAAGHGATAHHRQGNEQLKKLGEQ
jgi:hypothetical protein